MLSLRCLNLDLSRQPCTALSGGAVGIFGRILLGAEKPQGGWIRRVLITVTTTMGRKARSSEGVEDQTSERQACAPRYLTDYESTLDGWRVIRCGGVDPLLRTTETTTGQRKDAR